MLVSVDDQQGVVLIVDGNTATSVPVNDVAQLESLLAGRVVHYIRDVVEVAGEHVLELVSTMAPGAYAAPRAPVAPKPPADGRKWLHAATASGQINFPAGGITVKFENRGDFKPVDQFGGDMMRSNYPVIDSLLNSGKLEICSTAQMNKIRREYAKKMADWEHRRNNGVSIDVPIKDLDFKNMSNSLGRDADRGEPIDMDDMPEVPKGDMSMMLTDDQKFVLQNGWGKKPGAPIEASA